MLILTFFSNTIMNYSLVEVSTQQVTSGQITSKVRGSGSVEASESYSVTIEETRKIATVNVKKDAEVATGSAATYIVFALGCRGRTSSTTRWPLTCPLRAISAAPYIPGQPGIF